MTSKIFVLCLTSAVICVVRTWGYALAIGCYHNRATTNPCGAGAWRREGGGDGGRPSKRLHQIYYDHVPFLELPLSTTNLRIALRTLRQKLQRQRVGDKQLC